MIVTNINNINITFIYNMTCLNLFLKICNNINFLNYM